MLARNVAVSLLLLMRRAMLRCENAIHEPCCTPQGCQSKEALGLVIGLGIALGWYNGYDGNCSIQFCSGISFCPGCTIDGMLLHGLAIIVITFECFLTFWTPCFLGFWVV